MGDHVGSPRDLIVVLPVFNDWAALAKLLAALDAVLDGHGLAARVLVVDDGSTQPLPRDWDDRGFRAIWAVDVLFLRRNLGHQRAIAVGLSYVEDEIPCRAVVLMDADGEDAPRDVPALVARADAEVDAIVFAERTKRSESTLFRVCYALFKLVHRLLIGTWVRVGNFSVIPRRRLESLVAVSELWNHYAASVVKSRQRFVMVPTQRAKRLDGKSTMNFVALVIHGLSAISVYSEIVGVRVLLGSFALIGLAALGLVATASVRLVTDLAIPGWATTVSGLLVLLLAQTVMFSLGFSFLIIGGRAGASFLPVRDYRFFVSGRRAVYRRAEVESPA